MKKTLLAAFLAGASLVASAEAYERPAFSEGWTLGLTAGAVSPIKGESFFKNMRPAVGLVLDKKLTPAFAVGVEGTFTFNTSRWPNTFHSSTAFDHSYVGAYGALDFMGFCSNPLNRVFSMGIQAGAGWGHTYHTKAEGHDYNFFATKAGLFFNFNVSRHFTISIEPSVGFDMSDAHNTYASASYDARLATFQLNAGFKYHFGTSFETVRLYDELEIASLNNQINALRAEVAAAVAATALEAERAAALNAQLEECLSRKPEVIKEVSIDNRLNTVLDVFFNIGSAQITEAQMPNVERIADYLKSHPNYIVVIKGYASKDGNLDLNIKLAQKRAEAVRSALINKYGIKASRIKAEGAGIGEMFEVESWNRVSVCTLEQKK